MTHPIPRDALDDRLAILGTAGAGKTYLALGAEEMLLARGNRVVHVDPLGVAWGLRLMGDGKAPSGFNVVIFGGPHGDLPINEHAGALVGETVATMAESCILDLSQLGAKAAERRFMLPFLSALYRHKTQAPLHLVIDEADMFAPQKILDKEADAAKLLGMMETIVRRGRVKGFIPWLITQRPAVLNKDVLSQADGLVALKLTSSQDRQAIRAWVESTADVGQWKEIDGQLPGMQRGQGVLWIPGRGVLKTVQFPQKITFDSSKAPERGQTVKTVDLTPLNIDALKGKLATVEAEAKANDPKALKAEITKLRYELGKKQPQIITQDITAELAVSFQRGYMDGWSAATKQVSERAFAARAKVSKALELLTAADTVDLNGMAIPPAQDKTQSTIFPKPPSQVTPIPKSRVKYAEPMQTNGHMLPMSRKILNAIHAAFPVSLTYAAAAARAGASRRSSQYGDYEKQILASGEVENDNGHLRSRPEYAGHIISTGDPVETWASRLPPSYGKMLRVIASAKHGIDRGAIADMSGVSMTSSGLPAGLRELQDLALIDFDGELYTLSEGLRT